MRTDASTCRIPSPFTVVLAVVTAVVWGCGSMEETTEDDYRMDAATPISVTARLEYRVDSLMAENRRMRQQLDALATENSALAARNTDLEMNLRQAEDRPAPPVDIPPPPAATGSTVEAYSAALAEYRRRNFQGAISMFESLLIRGVREDLQDNCHYWIGESYYGLGKYTEAINHFEMVIGFVRSEKKDDAQLMIGNCYATMGNKTAAREAFNKLLTNYPASMYVKKAQEKLSRLN